MAEVASTFVRTNGKPLNIEWEEEVINGDLPANRMHVTSGKVASSILVKQNGDDDKEITTGMIAKSHCGGVQLVRNSKEAISNKARFDTSAAA
ncbi:MAG: hypothetical protein CYPHOPRED_002855 [Cyphobasidiales sp. Tagirdzhanova-0007]|nr:MAG: hypothetical protein CYPHOPRED_002855 [Cyphobasidiales sp. Tagirdzhanova-0007]